MLSRKHGFVVLVALQLATASALAQQSPMAVGSPPGWNAAMTRLFGGIQAFSARAELRVLDRSGKDSLVVPLNFALLDRKVRMDIDMTQMKGPQVPPDQISSMKQMAMERLSCVILPEKKSMNVIFPGLTAYVEMPLPEEEAAALNKEFKIDKSPLGKEKIDGHPCAKNRVVMTDERGQKLEFVVWNADDLKEFPVQAQMSDAGANVIILYRNVQLSRPDAKQFDAPSGYTKHRDFLELMQVAAARRGPGGAKKK
jgi:hypothetical protein